MTEGSTPESGKHPADVDMSPDGIDRRLVRVAQLLRLCRELSEARQLSDVAEGRAREDSAAGYGTGKPEC